MNNFKNERISETIEKIPSYEINRFLVAVSDNESKKQEKDYLKTKGCAAIDAEKKSGDFPPSCEFIDIGRDKSNE